MGIRQNIISATEEFYYQTRLVRHYSQTDPNPDARRRAEAARDRASERMAELRERAIRDQGKSAATVREWEQEGMSRGLHRDMPRVRGDGDRRSHPRDDDYRRGGERDSKEDDNWDRRRDPEDRHYSDKGGHRERGKAAKPTRRPRGGGGRGGLYGFAAEALILVVGDYLEAREEGREDARALARFIRAWGFEVDVHGNRLEITAGDLRPGTSFSTVATTANGNRYQISLRVDERGQVRGGVYYMDPRSYAQAPETGEERGGDGEGRAMRVSADTDASMAEALRSYARSTESDATRPLVFASADAALVHVLSHRSPAAPAADTSQPSAHSGRRPTERLV